MENENTRKTEAERLKGLLFLQPKNGGLVFDDAEIEKADAFCEGYKSFIGTVKTEREAVAYAVEAAKKHGFEPYDSKRSYAPGSKVYRNNRNKALILAVIGSKPVAEGVRISAAHIDSPRLDLKQNPLFEDTELGFFKTHYYGGIKKYQWTARPLALHGVVIRRDGTAVNVCVGEDEGDPQFCVTDLLPHLAKDQMKKPMTEGIQAEHMNVLIGSLPFRDDEASERVKLRLLKLLHEKYGIYESDFLSAELCLVPAGKAVDLGFDRNLIGCYGHDDRVCAYTALTALLECGEPETTSLCVLADKEETGSQGNTGLESAFLRYFVADLARPAGLCGRDVLSRSKCLSADVSAAFDPNYPDASEKRNASYVNYGVGICKYTGHGGKYDTSDASAEFTAEILRLFDAKKVMWHMCELGKVDQGGGGTVAKYIGNLDVDVIDVGVPVLSMHSPFEVVSKLDVYSAFKGFREFYKA